MVTSATYLLLLLQLMPSARDKLATFYDWAGLGLDDR